ncbi:ATP-binding cassette domain-containing protein [Actinocorallia longicatena]|uniref:ABC transporter domain-containing protein n=1 Tax=Actinocorallia longicatena TaxID=111803 RepID=A0ABP6PYF2_9ACTN
MGRAVVVAEELGVRTRRGWIFSGIELEAGAGELVAVGGAGGTGRSSFLLTLGGRMRPSMGDLWVCEQKSPPRIRGLVAVGRIGGAAEPEDELTVRDHVNERSIIAGKGREPFGTACERLGTRFEAGERVGGMATERRTLLALALALMERTPVVLLDDLDDGAPPAGQRRLWQAARRAADGGTVVIAATTDPDPAEGVADTVVRL